ncbi:MAG TPA: NAD(P)-binding oxidoreductase [Acidimicrobiales bacterium]|jgi:putative NADH-flavin reductase|nr:NAD(P)-binding oxidoreductase [Acidimicrobiales bacterium]
MHLTIFGATGRTGTCLVKQALAAGDSVTAVVRDPSRLSVPRRPGLDVVTADVTDPADIVPAIDEADAVVSTVGASTSGPTSITADSAASIVEAMEKTGCQRLVVVSGSIADDTGAGFVMRHALEPLARAMFLKHVCADMRRAESRVHASSLDWTIVRPPRLTNKAATGRYRSAAGHNLAHGYSISRADLAAFLLSVVRDPSTIHQDLFVAR